MNEILGDQKFSVHPITVLHQEHRDLLITLYVVCLNKNLTIILDLFV
jgi:hypothetical protein